VKRKLVLHKDTLAELTTDELAVIAGGAERALTPACPTNYCASGTCQISRLIDPCLTGSACTG
jgi:hypothetical protein